MRIRNRSMIVMASQGLRQGTAIIMGVILVRLIDKETFGTYRQVMVVYGVLCSLLTLQFNTSLFYYLPKLRPDERRTLLLQTLLMTLGGAGLVALAMLVGARHIAELFDNPRLTGAVQALALYPFLERILTLLPSFMISLDRPVRGGAYTLAETLLRLAGVSLAFYFGADLSTVMWVMVGTAAVVAFIGLLDMLRLSPVGYWQLRGSLVRDQLNFVWPLTATSVVGILNVQLGGILISIFFDPAEYAVYSCGAIQLPVVAIVTSSLASGMMPDMVRLADQGRKRDALSIWQEGARKSAWIIFPCFVFFMMVAQDLMVFLYGQEYAKAAWPFAIYLLILPIRVAIYSALLRAFGVTKPIAIGAVVALCTNLVAGTTLTWLGGQTLLGFIGPSVGTALATLASASYLLISLKRVLHTPMREIMRWRELGGMLLLCCIPGVLVFLVPLGGLPVALCLMVQGVLYAGLLFLISWKSGMLHADEKELVLMPFRMTGRMLTPSRK